MDATILDDLPLNSDWSVAWAAGLSDTDPLSPFLDDLWLRSWRKAYAPSGTFALVVVRRNDALVVGLPLVRSSVTIGGIRVRSLRAAASGLTARFGPWPSAITPADMTSALDAIVELEQGWTVLDIPDIVSGSSADIAMRSALLHRGLKFRTMDGRSSPFITCRSSFSDWLASRGRNLRSNRNRKLNRITREGTIEFVHLRGPNIGSADLDELYAVSRRSWKGAVSTDMGATLQTRRFFQGLTEGERVCCDVDAWLLKLNGTAVACQVYWGNSYRKSLLRTDFDLSHSGLSPGDVLQLYVIEQYHDMGVAEIDLGGQDYEYKLRLTDMVRRHTTYRVFRPTYAGHALYSLSNAASIVRSFLARSKRAISPPMRVA